MNRIFELINAQQDFAFETTLSTKSHKNRISEAQQKGFFATLIYYWLATPQLAERRVELRVKEGGHDIPKDVIHRRYFKGINNLFSIYIPLCDYTMIFDNSGLEPILVYEVKKGETGVVYDKDKWTSIKECLK